jgi:hypothetical protein
VFIATNTSRPKRSSTPASIPAAIDIGMRFIARSNHPVKPLSASRTADTTKAPIASAIGTPAALVTSIAAPGVDHAVTTGAR